LHENSALYGQSDDPRPAGRELALIQTLREDFPNTKILVFGPHADGDAFRQAKQVGTTSQVARGKVMERVWLEMMTA